MASGWIKLYRKLQDSDLWLSEPFTRGQAWIDLILLARFQDGYTRVRGIKVPVKRGQVAKSEIELSQRWQWSRSKTRRFLRELEEEQQIEQQKNNITTLITLINYEEYQTGDTADETPKNTASDTAADTASDTTESYISAPNASSQDRKNGKNGKNGQNGEEERDEKTSVSSFGSPDCSNNAPSREELLNRIQNQAVRDLVQKSIDLIATTRKSGKVADSVVCRYLRQLLQFEEWKIGTAITKYIEREDWLDRKGENYLLGILRGVTARDYREVIGRLQPARGNRESDPGPRDSPGPEEIKPRSFAQAESAERRTMARWLLSQQQGGSDAEQGSAEAGADQTVNCLPCSEAGG